MTDTNKPAKYRVYDRLEDKDIAEYTSNVQATGYCVQLEVEPLLKNGSWRYIVVPVRECDL